MLDEYMDHESNEPPDVPPPPRMKAGDLPPIDDPEPLTGGELGNADRPSAPLPGYAIIGETELSTLAPSALFDLNQAAMDDAVPDRPLIAPLAPMSVLRAEYENGNQVFVQQIDWLGEHGYIGIRRTRGDGDCFYRSLAFAYIERILNSADPILAAVQAVSRLESTQEMLEAVGFQRLVFEDFLEMFTTLIKRIVEPEPGVPMLTAKGLLEAFNAPEVSNSVVVYLRLLTSAQIRIDPDAYAPFLFHPELAIPMEPREFCENFVEAVGKEADHVQITALTRALCVNIFVAYLDGRLRTRSVSNNDKGKGKEREAVEVEFVEFQNGEEGLDPVRLLYRPGHYDILDSRCEEPDVDMEMA